MSGSCLLSMSHHNNLHNLLCEKHVYGSQFMEQAPSGRELWSSQDICLCPQKTDYEKDYESWQWVGALSLDTWTVKMNLFLQCGTLTPEVWSDVQSQPG